MTRIVDFIKDWFPNISPAMIRICITFIVVFVVAGIFRQKDSEKEHE